MLTALLLYGYAGAAVAQPGFSQSFSPSTIGPGSATALAFTITNTGDSGVTELAFDNELPAGVTFTDPAGARNDCGGMLTADGGGATLSLQNGRLAAGASCRVRALVRADAPGTYQNDSGDLTSSAGNSGSTSAALKVATDRPGFNRSFSPAEIGVGQRSRLESLIDNTSNSNPSSGLDFSEQLPQGLTVATPANAATTCGGTLTAEAGTHQVSLSGGVVPKAETCHVAVDVAAAWPGTHLAADAALSSYLFPYVVDSGRAVAALTATADPVYLTQRFEPNPAIAGETTEIVYRLRNRSREAAAVDVAFSEDLDAALSGLSAVGLPRDGVCGAGSSLSGTSVVSLSGGRLGPGASCEFRVTAQVPAATGEYTLTTSAITATLDGASLSADPGIGTLFVEPTPLLAKTYTSPLSPEGEAVVGPGEQLTARYTVTNTSASYDATALTFIDSPPSFLSVTNLPADGFCGPASTWSQPPNMPPSTRQANNLALAPGGSCTFEVGYTLADTVPNGVFGEAPTDFSATVDGQVLDGRATTDTFRTVTPPALALAVEQGVVTPGGTATLAVTLRNDSDGAVDADTYPDYDALGFELDLAAALAGLAVAPSGLPGGEVCGSGTVDAGSGSLTLSGGSLAPGAQCGFTVTLAVPENAPPGPVTLGGASVHSAVDGIAVDGPSGASATLNVANLAATADFGLETVAPGETATLAYTLINQAETEAATFIQFTHLLAERLAGLSPTGLPVDDVCGPGSQVSESGSGGLVLSGGALAAGASCSFDVTVAVPSSADTGDYRIPSEAINVDYASAPSTLILSPMTAVLRVQVPGEPRDLTVSNLDEPNPDNDPVDTAAEEAAGDVNGDGIEDALQGTVASFLSPVTGRPVGLEVGGGCDRITSFAVVTADSLGEGDGGWRYPEGVARFELPCEQATVSLYFQGAEVPPGATVRKFAPAEPGGGGPSEWFTLDGATVDAAAGRLTFSLVDGGLGDTTGVDGVIVDPVGLASPFPPLSERAVSIPATDRYWLLLGALGILLFGTAALRRGVA